MVRRPRRRAVRRRRRRHGVFTVLHGKKLGTPFKDLPPETQAKFLSKFGGRKKQKRPGPVHRGSYIDKNGVWHFMK